MDETGAFRVRDSFLSRQTAIGLACWLPAFVLMEIVDIILPVQLGFAAVAALWTAAEVRSERAVPIADAPDYFASIYLAFFGFFAAACFAARVPFQL